MRRKVEKCAGEGGEEERGRKTRRARVSEERCGGERGRERK